MPEPISTAFLDRDGVVNRKPPEGRYVETWDRFEFLPGAAAALAALRAVGIRLILVTNQRGIARGIIEPRRLDEIHRRMEDELRSAGAELAAILVCPHEVGTCDCRKPGLDLFRQAEEMFPDLDLATSILVGDSASDVEAGNRLGIRTYLVGEPSATAALLASRSDLRVDGVAPTLFDLVHRILLPAGDGK